MHVSLEWVSIAHRDRCVHMADPNVRYVLRSNPSYVTVERNQRVLEAYECLVSVSGLIYVEHKEALDPMLGAMVKVEGGMPDGSIFDARGTLIKEHGAYVVKFSTRNAIFIK